MDLDKKTTKEIERASHRAIDATPLIILTRSFRQHGMTQNQEATLKKAKKTGEETDKEKSKRGKRKEILDKITIKNYHQNLEP